MTRSPVFEAVPPKKRDPRPLADRMRERVRQMDEAVSRREETYASKENGAIVFRTRRVA
jgi:hypothetical protein